MKNVNIKKWQDFVSFIRDKIMDKATSEKINCLIKDSGKYKVFISISIAILVLVLMLIVIQQSWIKKEKNAIKSAINNRNEIEHVKPSPLKESRKLLVKNAKKEKKIGASANSLLARRKRTAPEIEKKIKEADMYFEYELYEKAAVIYRKLANTSSTSKWSDKVFSHLAECYYNQKEFEKALDIYRKVCNNYLNSPYKLNAQLRIGECLIIIGDFDEARRVLYALVGQEAKCKKAEDKSKIIEAYYKIADSYVEQAKTHLNKGGKDNRGNLY